ncbi:MULTISPECIES: hypothetical protein [unclassified Streptomyces]|nr:MULTISPECIES: hypothetical protein [unclassified Streptomyces]MYY03096.1 hypothetical protein [Streptomyces sp. SID4913]
MKLRWTSGACAPDWYYGVTPEWVRRDGKRVGFGVVVGRFYAYLTWR